MIFMLMLTLLIVLVGSAVMIWRRGRSDAATVIDSIIAFFMFAFVGISGVLGFVGHVFQADDTANLIGWPAGNPFQSEVAMANLAYGVAGLMCVRWAGSFRWATAIFTAVFLWGAGVVHIYEFVVHDNRNAGNIGMPFYVDIIMPAVLFGLLAAQQIINRRQPHMKIVTGERREKKVA